MAHGKKADEAVAPGGAAGGAAGGSQELRELTDERYRDLRRPKVVRFYRNGDRYFRARTLHITPHRYVSWPELLADLSRAVPLPYGVRRLYTPLGGSPVAGSVEALRDGEAYVCASFEPFRSVKYGANDAAGGRLPRWRGQRHPLDDRLSSSSGLTGDNGTVGSSVKNGLRATYPPTGRTAFGKTLPSIAGRDEVKATQSDNGLRQSDKRALAAPASNGLDKGVRQNFLRRPENYVPARPKVITVVRVGGHGPRRRITLLLNRRAAQSFEELLGDISEALGLPRWRTNHVRRLYTLRGREARSVSDFFRGDDVFLAATRKEPPSSEDLQAVLEELFPENPYAQRVSHRDGLKLHGATKKGPDKALKPLRRVNDGVVLKYDSDFEVEARRKLDPEFARMKGPAAHKVYVDNLEKQRNRFKQREREEAQRWERDRWQREQRELEQKRQARLKDGGAEDSSEEAQTEDESRVGKLWDLDEELKKLKKKRDESKRDEGNKPERLPQDRDRRTVRSDSDANPKKDKDFGTKGDDSEIPVRNYWNGESDKEIPRQYRHNNSNVAPHKGKAKNKLKDGDADKKSKKFPNLPMPIVSLQDIESRYEIGRTIGDGNFATVKECRRVSAGDDSAGEAEWDLAMKIIDKAKLVGREEMLRSEVALTTRLGQHPNVVRLVEAMESPSDAYLVLERVRGGDLFDAITESVRFTERHAAAMVADLCRALQYLHANNIVHRDVKPENLLVQRNADGGTTLKLADLGLAMEVTGPIYTVCGTPTYVAPEILAETGYGLEVDMWAAGVITYILLCGFPPFRSLERDQEELFEIIQLGEYEFLSPYWDHISDAAKDLVSRLLVVDTARRYTARQALHHPWVSDGGAGDHTDLHREVTMNIQRHFADRRRPLHR
ncbi:LOW QUALITY PROTEIN: serine/threonine-protein kinase DCLK1-like [Lethenteron reissneri]|uniref:LOW QUALITY PROTEIN: serine/threonine-protein kinase DCLK1-like n=1 Tax=Lethenteron reissneri TaxID=7753 RepID=UPI002AB77FF0|nr:LOW QUALITY PROTEIN: serine/threonine-protein kinase DCLK1-like [Lethenteron reissneri]